LNYPVLCPATSDFMTGVGQCETCAETKGGSSTSARDYPNLEMYLTWCTKNTPSKRDLDRV
jgi:hypothetical protein